MTEYQEFTGRTVEEALRNARESFGVSGLDDLDFEILTPGSRGVLGMGAEPARIIAAPRSALGGAAPRREAAAAAPLPPGPRRDDRGPRDRGPRDDRGARGYRDDRGPRDRDAHRGAPPPRDERPVAEPRPPRDDRPREERPREERRDRVSRDDRGARAPRPAARDDRRGGGLSQREADEVATARATLASEREEIQAAEASPEALAAGKEILEQLVSLMGYRATVTVHSGTTSKIDITGDDDEEREALGALIGRKGERLSALQHLVNLMLSRRMGEWTRVLVDVEDYRGRRERQLVELARRAADRVLETGTMLQLEPMPALERRWVHLALRGIPGVATQSIGEEPQRRIVVLRVGD
jgi:spoIIIJ-associated protein